MYIFTKKIIKILFISLFFSIEIFAQSTQTVRGKIIDASNDSPISDASITLNGQIQKTNSNGEFRFEKIQTGRISLKISHVGYENQDIAELILESGKELILEIKLSESITQLTETVVKAASPNLSGALTSLNNITIEQVMRYSATFLDPARLATSFAGVANDNDQANGMVIRGNSPNGLQWRLEGVEIVNPNHLSNAGTFNDRPTQNAGGVNILSAQLLGNMNFLTGAFPAEYGNALSGVMDMRLRKGNDENHEFIAQAGVIGIDLAAEGPFSKKSKASYLVNYRYSFTGLLGAMGVTFGDEDIRFQDLSMNFSFPSKKLGDFTIFGIGGISTNDFLSKDDKSLWTSEKDQFDISFGNKMFATGITHQKNFGEKILWRNVLANSALESERNQSNSTFEIDEKLKKSKTTFSSILSFKTNKSLLKGGVFITRQQDSWAKIAQTNSTFTADEFVIQPFVNFNSKISNKFSGNIGLHFLNYSEQNQNSIEPRFSLNYHLSEKNNLSFGYGLHSQLQILPNFANFALLKSHHFVLGNQQNFKNNSYLKTEIYLQNHFDIPIKAATAAQLKGFSYSLFNLSNEKIPTKLENNGTAQNYGVEITYQQYLFKGFYSLLNTSFYKSTYVASDGIRRNSRFDGNYIFNATFGKEFEKSKNRIFGLNARIVWLGGYRETPIDEAASAKENLTIYDETKAWSLKQKDYFRPDLRVYFKKSKAKYSRMWSIDIQNFTNSENVAFSYYDTFLKKVVVKNQLGMIPMLNYRWEF